MATTGLYSQHLHNRKVLYLRNIIIAIILIVLAVATLFPICYMFLSAFGPNVATAGNMRTILPSRLTLESFNAFFHFSDYSLRWILNSLVVATGVVIGNVIFASMAGYAFARTEFPFKNFIFVLLLSVLMVPGQIFLLPQYQLIQKMGLLNTIPALFLPNLFSAFGTFLLRQFFMSMPQELEDAAIVDGCNRFQIFGRIMVPLIQPGIAALTIFTFKFAWNDFMWPLIVNNSMDKLILGPALSTLQGQYTTQYPMQMAGAVLAVIPLVVIFFIFQKQFIESVATSGIKG